MAQPLFFSEPTPLTTTRYVAYGGEARMVTNGVLPYLLWTTDGKVRITPTAARRVGRPVLDADSADAVWTGSHFVVVGVQSSAARYLGRLVGADGEAIGEPFTVVANAPVSQPRLAFDGRRVLLLYGTTPLKAVHLSRDGRALEEPRNAPIDLATVADLDVAARSEEFLVALAGQQGIATASVRNGAWTEALLPATEHPARRIATAASSSDALTIWTNPGAAMQARVVATVPRPGDITDYTLSGTEGASAVDVTYDGKDYVYAYRIGTRVYFRYFNAALPFASVDAASFSWISLTSVNGRTYAAWHAAGGGSPIIVRDVLTRAGDGGAFGAASQRLASTASSPTSALVVWFEPGGQLYAGVRTASGGWFERQIPNQDEQAPLAASDGNGFVIVQSTAAQGWTATLLDGQANILGTGPRVPFQPTGITWTGDAYVVVGLNASGQVVASRLSPAGTVTAPIILALPRAGRQIDHARVTSRGNELLVVWTDLRAVVCFPPCEGFESDVLGARLTPTLERVDLQSLRLVTGFAISPDVVWDGTRYVIVWSELGKIHYRTLRTNSAVSGITTIAGVTGARKAQATLVPGGVAITSDTGHVVFLREGDSVLQLGRRDRDAIATVGSRVAYVQALSRDEMPYHGATRLNIRIGDLVAPGPKPSAPRITRADLPTAGPAMIIEWTAPPEPVNGYRVEYRVNDSAWNELDVWFDARTTRLVIRPWRTDPVRYQFRVRAVNDAGFGAYSAPATVRTKKIRAVR